MRIFVNALSSRTGGSETYVTNLLPHISNLNPKIFYDVLIVQSRHKNYLGLPNNVHLQCVPDKDIDTNKQRLWYEHIYIPQLHRKNRYDIHWETGDLLSPMFALRKIPSIAVFHATQYLFIPKETGHTPYRLLYDRLIRAMTARHAEFPITVSNYAKEQLIQAYPRLRHKLQVIYHGINPTLFAAHQNCDDASPKLPDKYILSVSNRYPFKNYVRLVEAYCELVHATSCSEHLVLIGEPKSEEIESQIIQISEQHNLQDRIHCINYVPQKQLPQCYHRASLYVFPSLFETFGFTPLEAMAAGLPCVCSNASCLPEIMEDNVYYFNPEEVQSICSAMQKTLTDIQLRKKLIDLGLQHVQKFSWQSTAGQYLKLFENVT